MLHFRVGGHEGSHIHPNCILHLHLFLQHFLAVVFNENGFLSRVLIIMVKLRRAHWLTVTAESGRLPGGRPDCQPGQR